MIPSRRIWPGLRTLWIAWYRWKWVLMKKFKQYNWWVLYRTCGRDLLLPWAILCMVVWNSMPLYHRCTRSTRDEMQELRNIVALNPHWRIMRELIEAEQLREVIVKGELSPSSMNNFKVRQESIQGIRRGIRRSVNDRYVFIVKRRWWAPWR